MDNAKFCSNSRGSCWETLDHLIAAHDEGLISDIQLNQGRELVYKAIRLLNGYMNYLSKAGKRNPNAVKEPHAEYGTE
jgi:four helix bundle protein